MTQQVPSEVFEIWSRIAEPYRAVARALGYELLETMPIGWTTSFSCVDVWYRRGTYLDLSASIVLEGRPAGIAPGFHGAQFHTFTRHGGRLRDIWTLALADPEPKAFGFNAWFTQTLIAPLFRWALPTGAEIKMKTPAALADADRNHSARVGNAGPIVGENPLELRWALQEALERRAEDEDQ